MPQMVFRFGENRATPFFTRAAEGGAERAGFCPPLSFCRPGCRPLLVVRREGDDVGLVVEEHVEDVQDVAPAQQAVAVDPVPSPRSASRTVCMLKRVLPRIISTLLAIGAEEDPERPEPVEAL